MYVCLWVCVRAQRYKTRSMGLLARIDGSAISFRRLRTLPPPHHHHHHHHPLQERDEEIRSNGLEPEPSGVNDLLVNDEFEPEDDPAAHELGRQVTQATTSVNVRKGMDLVRVGNVGELGIAFFYERVKMPPSPALMARVRDQIAPALIEVAQVFQVRA